MLASTIEQAQGVYTLFLTIIKVELVPKNLERKHMKFSLIASINLVKKKSLIAACVSLLKYNFWFFAQFLNHTLNISFSL